MKPCAKLYSRSVRWRTSQNSSRRKATTTTKQKYEEKNNIICLQNLNDNVTELVILNQNKNERKTQTRKNTQTHYPTRDTDEIYRTL